MKDSTFSEIRQLVYDRSGISLGNNKQALVRARISKRMRNLNLKTYEDYMDYVRQEGLDAEIEQMLDAISTNTTQFYREPVHFVLLREIVQEWLRVGKKQLRIWSTASSTGEEPYTLAIELLEALALPGFDVKILATDLAPSVLKTAQKGEYSIDKIESIPKHLLNKYFTSQKSKADIKYIVKPFLKQVVIFRQFNLSVTPYPLKKPIDIIFCRNVMIYFDRQMRSRLLNEFRRLLKPGGYLFVGHAESIAGISTGFKCIQPSVYLKE